jgi:hypothetical protein
VNLVKADSYISNKEDGEARLKHLISAYRENHNLPELTEDGGDYADGIKRSGGSGVEPAIRQSAFSKFRRRRHQHNNGNALSQSLVPHFV